MVYCPKLYIWIEAIKGKMETNGFKEKKKRKNYPTLNLEISARAINDEKNTHHIARNTC